MYWEIYHQKIKTFQMKNSGGFHISAQNIESVLTSMFLSRNKKK